MMGWLDSCVSVMLQWYHNDMMGWLDSCVILML